MVLLSQKILMAGAGRGGSSGEGEPTSLVKWSVWNPSCAYSAACTPEQSGDRVVPRLLTTLTGAGPLLVARWMDGSPGTKRRDDVQPRAGSVAGFFQLRDKALWLLRALRDALCGIGDGEVLLRYLCVSNYLSCSCVHDNEQRAASRTSCVPACARVCLLCCIMCVGRADDDRTRTRVPALCLRGIDPNKRADDRQGEGFPSGGHALPSLSLVPLRENGFTLGDILPSSLSPFDTSRPQR